MFYLIHLGAGLFVALVGAQLALSIFANSAGQNAFHPKDRARAMWLVALILFFVFALAQISAWGALYLYYANRSVQQAAPTQCRGPRCIKERWKRESGDYSEWPTPERSPR